MNRWTAAAVVLWACSAFGAAADDSLAQRFPAGSIATGDDVRSALQAARAESLRVDAAFEAQKKRCATEILVYACEDKAQRSRNRARTEIQRVELEARDRQRALDAQERDARRAAAGQETRSEPPVERRAGAARAVEDGAARELKAQLKAQQNKDTYEEALRQLRAKEAARAAEAAERAANAKAFADKQLEAQKYAAEKAKEKEDNERRRAERKRKREADAARGQAVPSR